MVERLTRQQIAAQAIVHQAPVLRAPHTVDRNFEMPTGLYVAMAGLFSAAFAVMALGFANPAMILPTAIIALFIAMFFAVPAAWVRMKPASAQHALSWERFRRHGIMTAFGHSSANAAAIQVLILPALLLVWGIAVVAIAALVH